MYREPAPLRSLNHVRDESSWTAYFFPAPLLVADLLALLDQGAPLFTSMGGKRYRGDYEISGIAFQTNNPTEEQE